MKTATKTPPLRIAQVAPLWSRTPPETYGGTELMVHLLVEELTRRGHDVTLYATGDSCTSGRLQAVCPDSVRAAMARGEAYEYEHYANALLVEALREAASFDVIHCHLGCAFVPLGRVSHTPILHTQHVVLSVDDLWVLNRYPEVPITAISCHQAAAIPQQRHGNVRVIYHGIDFDAYDFSTRPGDYLAFLGRMGPQKSPLDAIRIARAARMRLVLAGRPQNAEEEVYFTQKVKPMIDGTAVTYIGPVDHQRKNQLLKNAAALLFPIQGEEAFGLAMVEAMACGTPVIGWDQSSVVEVVDFGQTGFYGDSVEMLADFVPRALALDRRALRAQARQRFSYTRMADDYLDVYQQLAERGRRP
jgi:glycosyltransferase involved in cell wall biosynthesis